MTKLISFRKERIMEYTKIMDKKRWRILRHSRVGIVPIATGNSFFDFEKQKGGD